MNTPATSADLDAIFGLFDYPPGTEPRRQLAQEMLQLEQTARHQMRASLPRTEFAAVRALADAASAALAILTGTFGADACSAPSTPTFHRTFTNRSYTK